MDETYEWLKGYFGMDKEASAAKEQEVSVAQEKIASDLLFARSAVEQLEKDAAASGVDLTQYDDDAILQLALERAQGTQEKTAGQQMTPEQEFVELHKFAGQIQGFSAFQTLQQLLKEGAAAEEVASASGKLKNLGSKAWDALKGAERKASGAVGDATRTSGQKSKAWEDAAKSVKEEESALLSPRGKMNLTEQRVKDEQLSRGRKIIGGTAAALGVGGAGAVAATKKDGKTAEASAVENLIELRQIDMLKEAGYVDQNGNVVAPDAPQEKTAEFMSAIDAEALRRLHKLGYR
jgi:hypothetical protein